MGSVPFRLLLICVAVFAVHHVCADSEDDASTFVKEGNPSNFDDLVVNSKKYSLVGFFAPWCGHCKSMKPTWAKAAELFSEEPHVQIVSVDADEHRSLGMKYNVQGFPTLKYIGPDGGETPYEGGRQLEDIVSFLNEKAGTEVSPDGSVSPKGGLLPQVHEFLVGFRSARPEEQQAMLDKAAAVANTDEKNSDRWALYSKIGRKIIADGMDYIRKERTRVSKMLSKNAESLSADQRKAFHRRVNVLSAFDEL